MSEFTDGTMTGNTLSMVEMEKRLEALTTAVNALKSESGGLLPGTVTAFSGTFNDGYPVNKNTGLVNREWHLCDGTNGTPDLRSRFIYGGDGTNNGATGGEAKHTLSVSELPRFTPTANVSSYGGDYSSDMSHNSTNTLAAGAGSNSSHNESVVSKPFKSIGGDQPHNNMPPYYVLAFIMKL